MQIKYELWLRGEGIDEFRIGNPDGYDTMETATTHADKWYVPYLSKGHRIVVCKVTRQVEDTLRKAE